MQAIHADNVNWKMKSRGVREAEIFRSYAGSEETRIDLVEVPAGGYIPPHRHSSRREFITILLSAGAQLQIGDRIFRPIAGQVFHREPRDVLALTNDSHHPFRYSVVRFGYESSDIEWLNEKDAPEDFVGREAGADTVLVFPSPSEPEAITEVADQVEAPSDPQPEVAVVEVEALEISESETEPSQPLEVQALQAAEVAQTPEAPKEQASPKERPSAKAKTSGKSGKSGKAGKSKKGKKK